MGIMVDECDGRDAGQECMTTGGISCWGYAMLCCRTTDEPARRRFGHGLDDGLRDGTAEGSFSNCMFSFLCFFSSCLYLGIIVLALFFWG